MDAEWYVSRGGNSTGPFSYDQMAAAARSGQLKKEDLTWKLGMETWLPAASITVLWRPPALPTQPANVPSPLPVEQSKPQPKEERLYVQAQPASTSAIKDTSTKPVASNGAVESEEQQEASKSPNGNFFIRHWRGELSLPASYWLVGTLLSICLILLGECCGNALGRLNLSPRSLGFWLLAFLTALSVCTIWQLIGVWRSAGNHIIKTKRKGWAVAARVMVVLGACRAIVDFSNVIGPMLSTSAQMAAGQNNLPAHEFRLLREGSELELSGGMTYGTAEALQKFLDAASAVKVVHLNSMGGFVSEGILINKLLSSRNLITYTSRDCTSACTIAFLGGSRRYLSDKARLGFHSASFGSLDQKTLPESNNEMRSVLTASGIPDVFVDKALATDSTSMWYPTSSDLVRAKIVTAVVDPREFAISGVKEWRDPNKIEDAFSQLPYARALKEANHEAYTRLAISFSEGIKLGKSGNELMNELHVVFTSEVLPIYLRTAPNDALARYWKSQIAEMRHLNNTPGTLCLEFLRLVPRSSGSNLNKILPSSLVNEDMASLMNMIETTPVAPNAQLAALPDTQKDFAEAIAALEKRNPGAWTMVFEPDKYTSKPQELCKAFVDFYDSILAMPSERSGPMLKAISTPSN